MRLPIVLVTLVLTWLTSKDMSRGEADLSSRDLFVLGLMLALGALALITDTVVEWRHPRTPVQPQPAEHAADRVTEPSGTPVTGAHPHPEAAPGDVHTLERTWTHRNTGSLDWIATPADRLTDGQRQAYPHPCGWTGCERRYARADVRNLHEINTHGSTAVRTDAEPGTAERIRQAQERGERT